MVVLSIPIIINYDRYTFYFLRLIIVIRYTLNKCLRKQIQIQRFGWNFIDSFSETANSFKGSSVWPLAELFLKNDQYYFTLSTGYDSQDMGVQVHISEDQTSPDIAFNTRFLVENNFHYLQRREPYLVALVHDIN